MQPQHAVQFIPNVDNMRGVK